MNSDNHVKQLTKQFSKRNYMTALTRLNCYMYWPTEQAYYALTLRISFKNNAKIR